METKSNTLNIQANPITHQHSDQANASDCNTASATRIIDNSLTCFYGPPLSQPLAGRAVEASAAPPEQETYYEASCFHYHADDILITLWFIPPRSIRLRTLEEWLDTSEHAPTQSRARAYIRTERGRLYSGVSAYGVVDRLWGQNPLSLPVTHHVVFALQLAHPAITVKRLHYQRHNEL